MRSGDMSSFSLAKPDARHERKSRIVDDPKAVHYAAHDMCHLVSGRRRERVGLGERYSRGLVSRVCLL